MTNDEWWVLDLDERNNLIDKWMEEGDGYARIGFVIACVGMGLLSFNLLVILWMILGLILFNIGIFIMLYGYEHGRVFRFYHEEEKTA